MTRFPGGTTPHPVRIPRMTRCSSDNQAPYGGQLVTLTASTQSCLMVPASAPKKDGPVGITMTEKCRHGMDARFCALCNRKTAAQRSGAKRTSRGGSRSEVTQRACFASTASATETSSKPSGTMLSPKQACEQPTRAERGCVREVAVCRRIAKGWLRL